VAPFSPDVDYAMSLPGRQENEELTMGKELSEVLGSIVPDGRVSCVTRLVAVSPVLEGMQRGYPDCCLISPAPACGSATPTARHLVCQQSSVASCAAHPIPVRETDSLRPPTDSSPGAGFGLTRPAHPRHAPRDFGGSLAPAESCAGRRTAAKTKFHKPRDWLQHAMCCSRAS
jgi:hypothetical protein